jgi:hypothetical protein
VSEWLVVGARRQGGAMQEEEKGARDRRIYTETIDFAPLAPAELHGFEALSAVDKDTVISHVHCSSTLQNLLYSRLFCEAPQLGESLRQQEQQKRQQEQQNAQDKSSLFGSDAATLLATTHQEMAEECCKLQMPLALELTKRFALTGRCLLVGLALDELSASRPSELAVEAWIARAFERRLGTEMPARIELRRQVQVDLAESLWAEGVERIAMRFPRLLLALFATPRVSNSKSAARICAKSLCAARKASAQALAFDSRRCEDYKTWLHAPADLPVDELRSCLQANLADSVVTVLIHDCSQINTPRAELYCELVAGGTRALSDALFVTATLLATRCAQDLLSFQFDSTACFMMPRLRSPVLEGWLLALRSALDVAPDARVDIFLLADAQPRAAELLAVRDHLIATGTLAKTRVALFIVTRN